MATGEPRLHHQVLLHPQASPCSPTPENLPLDGELGRQGLHVFHFLVPPRVCAHGWGSGALERWRKGHERGLNSHRTQPCVQQPWTSFLQILRDLERSAGRKRWKVHQLPGTRITTSPLELTIELTWEPDFKSTVCPLGSELVRTSHPRGVSC